MSHIALITYTDFPGLSESDKMLLALLKKEGQVVTVVPWDKDGVDWSVFSCVIIRSCWNYYEKFDDFLRWLGILQKSTITVWNPISVIEWNIRKTYIRDLASVGISVVPIVFLEQDSRELLQDICIENKWEEIIIKPTVGASAHGVYKIHKREAESKQVLVTELLKESAVMVQPFMKEIENGEYSIIFIGKRYSHAVLKVPKRGEFRVNYEQGSREEITEIDKDLLLQAQAVVDTIEPSLLYTRVDGIIVDGKFMLMELELIEPHLYFDLYPEGAEKFVSTLIELEKISNL